MSRVDTDPTVDPADAPLGAELMLSPFKATEWRALSPGERLARAWALRQRLVDPEAVHDRKLFPAP